MEIDGLEFSGPLELEKTSGVTVRECVFSGSAAGIRARESAELKVDRCTFADTAEAMGLEKSPHAGVIQNLFVRCGTAFRLDAETAGTFFSDFNAFTKISAKVADKSHSGLAEWQKATMRDVNSVEGKISLDPSFTLDPADPLAVRAADFGALGARTEPPGARLGMENLQVAGLSARGATVLWDSPRQATFGELTLKTASGEVVRSWEPALLLQIMATSFDVNRLHDAFYSSQRHAVLPELKPDTAYEVTLVARDADGHRSTPFTLNFRTPKDDAAASTYFLSPAGDDSATGKSREKPWRTFAHATAQLKPGDELILLPGRYQETLRPRVGGTKDRPITIRAEKPGEAVLDLAQSLPVAVEILNVNHLTVDGLRIENGAFPRSQCYVLNQAEGITIRNCEVAYPSVATFEALKLGYNGLVAHEAPGLRVENNLFLCCVTGTAVSNSPDTVIRGNTFIGEGNYGVVIIPGSAEESYTVEDNLFYRAVMGYKTGPCIWVFDPMPKLVCDHNLFFIPEKHKGTIGKLPDTDRLFPLDAWQKGSGLDKNSLAAEPVFRNPETGDFSLQPSSPGTTLARDGGPVGQRKK